MTAPCTRATAKQAYKGFEIMMAFCRSVVERGQIALPLQDGPAELDALAKVLPDKPVLLSSGEPQGIPGTGETVSA